MTQVIHILFASSYFRGWIRCVWRKYFWKIESDDRNAVQGPTYLSVSDVIIKMQNDFCNGDLTILTILDFDIPQIALISYFSVD